MAAWTRCPRWTRPPCGTRLRGVVDPELGDNIVDLGMVDAVEVRPGGAVMVRVALTTPSCPLRGQIKAEVMARAGGVPGVSGRRRRDERHGARTKGRPDGQSPLESARSGHPRPPSRPGPGCIAVSSGKGGVGKSSVSVNLAAGLAARGYIVGVLDADIAGFSVPRMLGVSGQLEATRDADDPERKLIRPLVRPIGEGEVRVVSMGFLAGEDEAVMWRGLMLNRAVQHFLEDVAWGDIDYLVVDMPPGTGDIQMGLARMLPSAEVLVVTTPGQTAQKVAARAATMARKSYLRVVGVVENMSAFVLLARRALRALRARGRPTPGGRDRRPACWPASPSSPPSPGAGTPVNRPPWTGTARPGSAFAGLVDAILERCPVLQMTSCSARVLEALGALGRAASPVAPAG